MNKYSVTINLDDETLEALNNGFQMQVYKGIQTSAKAQPTVWFTVDEFASAVRVSWEEQYGGYFSRTDMADRVKINIATQQEMNSGDIITLSDAGNSSVSSGGEPGAFSFNSDECETWTSGLMLKDQKGSLSPICAFPQYHSVENFIEPYEKVLILFSQGELDTGMVVEDVTSQSVSVVLSTSDPSTSLNYSINDGWDTLGNPQATVNPANFNLTEDLVIPSV